MAHDTIVVGDSSAAKAQATDAQGHLIQALGFALELGRQHDRGFSRLPFRRAMLMRWVVAPDRSSPKRTGRSVVTLALPDPRFVVTSVTRTEVAVVGGVKVLSSRDTTLTAINDTAFAIAAGQVHANGALVTRVSTGIKWTHLGTHTPRLWVPGIRFGTSPARMGRIR